MHNEQLFDHKSLQIYSLLLLLHLHNNHIHKSELCQALKITSPTLSQLTEQINGFDPQLLTITRHEIILDLPYSSQAVQSLNKQILSSSLRFQLLDLYFKHSTLTREETARALNISLTSTNKLIGECNELLREFNLEIKQNMLRGTGSQFFYFYFNFYWNNHAKSTALREFVISDHGFKAYAKEKLGSQLSIIQNDQISLWLSLLSNKHELIQTYFSKQKSSTLFFEVKVTPLYQALTNYFKQNWFFLDHDLAEYYSYLTFIFLNTYNIISYPVTEINSLFKHSKCQQLLEQVTTILTNSYNFNNNFNALRSSLYFTINKLLLLDGYYYSNTILNLEAKKEASQPFEEKVIAEILNIPLAQSFNLNTYKLQAIRDNLKMMIYPHKNMKRRCISIGVVSQLPIATRYAYITEIQNILSKGHNISVNDYLEQAHYDLVITDFNLQDLASFKAPILYLDDLEVPNNVKLLEEAVSRLESEMYQPLLLN
ncbi:helix-turn-helix domain-containing protein [Ligilactobacillus apodemi]|uniref:Mga helix-turn-helix domain-containing protein n=1 Tax=Ligilactobacillus apodemi DSM 16634 = JCM 16172 TaxID=1423724 RepID=A0A0R1TYJ9_9LACO|nr:helix-turn-helix domain-containing protein [Ligilactobacillus apodemi]KRL83650.1 hypothetical protein FC32_GL000910 [Ligilactobacillus apodemi DSM 16634 = JCM 16172]